MMSTTRNAKLTIRFHLAIALLLVASVIGCGQAAETTTGREWVNRGLSVERSLEPDGRLSIDKRIHPIVQGNYAGFIQQVASVFGKKQLYNRTPTPFRIYMMYDAADFAAYGGRELDGLGTFVAEQRAIYLHADGRPLVDRGQNRRLVRELALAVIHDMYEASYPKWFAVGLSRYLADGAFDADKWNRGVPDAGAWQPLLARRDQGIAALLQASDAEFDALGEFGGAFAQAVVYLLRELDKDRFGAIVYQMQKRSLADNQDLLGLFDEFIPNHKKHLKQPVVTLFKLRPDLLAYLECGGAEPSAEVLKRSRANAETLESNGSYWYQCASLEAAVGSVPALRIAALERSRKCEAHRFMPACLDDLAEIYRAESRFVALADVASQRLRISVNPTPRMQLWLAEALADKDPVGARRHVMAGLDLPADGFAAEVKALQILLERLQ